MRRRSYRVVIAGVLFILLFIFLKQKEILESSRFQQSSPPTDIENYTSEFPLPSVPRPRPRPRPQSKNSDYDASLLETANSQNPIPDPVSDAEMRPLGSQIERKPHEPSKKLSNRNITLAIMTTILNPDPTFSVWLDYHLRRFDLIMVFLDDPSEQPTLERLVRGKPVVFFNGSTEWSDSAPDRLIMRQVANVNVALAYALSKNITWLLHIDIDELFYEDGDRSWETWDHVGSIQFINHEAIASPREVVNFFEECTIFRLDGCRTGFFAYVLGKSVVRVTPGAYADGPHLFYGYQGEKLDVRVPMILHYPTPTFDRWVEKYKLYGNFSDLWFEDPNRPMMQSMAKSRDLVRAAMASGNWNDAREYYYSWIPDNATMEQYLSEGEFRRMTPLTDMR